MAGHTTTHEMNQFSDHIPVIRETKASKESDSQNGTRDHADLARLGKTPVLQRKFGFMAILGFSCTVLVTWEAILITFEVGFSNGGPAGMVYNYIIVWAGSWAVFATLCELASMAPVAGGQYYWVAFLAPPSWQRFMSYITGWMTLCGWQAAVASGSFVSGTLIQGLIVLNNPSYDPKPWHGTLLFWAVYAFVVAINTMGRYFLPRFESLVLILHVLGFFAVVLPMTILGPRADSSDVFNKFLNEGNWPTQGLSFMVGISGAIFAFTGADAAIHMSEEIKDASIVVPRSIMLSIFINGATGFGMVIATLYCIGNVDDALNSPTDYPFMEILAQATGSIGGATVLAAIIAVMQISGAVGFLASASRMLWSFSQDRAVPGWKFWKQVDRRTSIPLRCIGLTSIISILLSLINLGSSTAFNDIVSLPVAGLYSSYLLVATLLLWRRLKGDIRPYSSLTTEVVNNSGTELMWGPWRIPGVLGTAVNAFAVAFATLAMFFIFWPPEQPVTAENMNYACLIWGVVVIVAVLYYVLRARKFYQGPVGSMN